LQLDQFHRFKKTHKKKPSGKKKLRDIERLLQQPNLPEDLVARKKEEVKDLKKAVKQRKEAEKFELRYKKVRFVEKRKVIRKLE
jgi:hypothetical protein